MSYTVSASDRQEQFVTVLILIAGFLTFIREKSGRPGERASTRWTYVTPCSNSIRATSNLEGHLHAEVAGLNPVLPCCETNQELWFSLSPGRTTVEIGGDDYPDFETVQYRRGQAPQMLARSTAGSWVGGLNSHPFTFPLVNTWENGKCVGGFGCLDAY